MTHNKRLSLVEVQEQFQTWRATRRCKTNIPENLWSAAITLADQYSLTKISTTLQVNYTALKERIVLSKVHETSSEPSQPAFLELPQVPSLAGPECVVEMENSHGERIRIHFSKDFDLDLPGLVQNFWVNRP